MKRRILCLLFALLTFLGALSSCVPQKAQCVVCFDDNLDGICDACGSDYIDPDRHFCTDSDKNSVCDECGAFVIIGDYPWSHTKLRFAMNLHSHGAELYSGATRYLAGADSDGSELVNEVIIRNVKAETYTKTVIEYDYWLDGNDLYEWNASHSHILSLINTDSSTQPDIYSTFLYDMVAASLERCFANLKTTHYLKDTGNHFRFANDADYKNTVGDSEGYMMEFMESLTLSPSKMYLLGSDYFIDTVRAFFLVPANVDLLNQLGVTVKEQYAAQGLGLPSTGAFKDRTGPAGVPDGNFTVDDFIQLIWDREWTYDAIREYSNAIYKDNDFNGSKSALDTLGFVLESGSGFSPSGVLYTSSFTIIEKTLSDGEWNYCYPAVRWDSSTGAWVHDDSLASNASAEALFTLEGKVTELFSSTGVLAARGQIQQAYSTTSDERELVSIRNKFKDGTLLFGGLILTGHLEESQYADIKENTDGGFAIAPGPLYTALTANEYHSDSTVTTGKTYRDYQTLMHNTGRLGGISVNTKKFSQCSAYLDYQSTHSTDILEEYYEEKLTRAGAGTENGNDDVMRFIREHVRSIFDKAFEDAIAFSYSDDNAAAKTWHSLMNTNGLQPNGVIATNYSSLSVAKQQCLQDLKAEYENLPEITARP